MSKKFCRCNDPVFEGNSCFNCGDISLGRNKMTGERKFDIENNYRTHVFSSSVNRDNSSPNITSVNGILENEQFEATTKINYTNEDNSSDQCKTELPTVPIIQDVFIGPNLLKTRVQVHRNGSDTYPCDEDKIGSLRNLNMNEIIQPVSELTLNGSEIFLPPVKVAKHLEKVEIVNSQNEIDKIPQNGIKYTIGNKNVTELPTVPKVIETNDVLSQSLAKICEIRGFLKKVSSERKNYIDNILNSNK